MSNFTEFSNRLSELDNEASADLTNVLKTKTYNKGDYLLKRGQICRQLFFIDKGITKTFFYKNDKEFIMRFFTENAMFTVLDSFLYQIPSNYMIMALEPATVTYLLQSDMETLCKKHHAIETFFRKLLSVASLNMMKRISEMLEENPAERYTNFMKEHSSLLQRISLGDLASYIGITQVSLSRIRARK